MKNGLSAASAGMQKQAAFWLALCCMPDYLILDRPVDGLDPVMRRQVCGLWCWMWPSEAPRCWFLPTTCGVEDVTWASWTTAACCWSGP